MAKSSTERHMDWRNRVMLKARIFDDLNAERAARIRQSFPGDDRPEVRAVVEFFANYPRCQHAPRLINMQHGIWSVYLSDQGTDYFEAAAAKMALAEVTSMPVIVDAPLLSHPVMEQVRDEVAEMRALGLWGRS
jgi:hypothetical protein